MTGAAQGPGNGSRKVAGQLSEQTGVDAGGNGRLLAADEVAVLLGVPKSWVYAETRAGRIPHITLGRYRRYRRDTLEAWLSQRERGPVPARPR